MMRYRVLLVFTFFFLSNNTLARDTSISEEFRQAPDNIKLYYAYAEFKMGKYAEAKNMWEHISDSGKPEALFNLGILYELGKGVDVDIQKAADFYRTAAELGSFAGAYQMGLMHMSAPDIVSQDESVHWLGVAAEEGDEDALDLLASISSEYIDSMTRIRILLAKQEFTEAITSLKIISNNRELPDTERAKAFTQLGWVYEVGKGVESDLEQASIYFAQGAELGDSESMYSIAVMYLTGKGMPLDESLGNEWMEKSANLGFAKAKNKLLN